MSDNLDLWSSVDTTDPAHTKKVNQRGGFTAIAAQSQVKKATEMFGPFGLSGCWGVKNEQFTTMEDVGMVIYTATLWYSYNDRTGELPIHSSIKYHSNNRVDDDFSKKVATDALTKGLSKLGFNADVFMGLFDDNKYVAKVSKQFSSNGQDDNWLNNVKDAMDGLSDTDKKAVKESIQNGKLNSSNYKPSIKRIVELKQSYKDLTTTI
tara:strand:+ start:426 stop:1049 length:624 start_codon:yes stop_codon:yes gene_type:complete